MTRLIAGTRGSALALKQTSLVVAALQAAHPDLEIETRVIQTGGDRSQAANVPLSSYSEKGIFAREIESALLAGEIDFAVHSMKDLAHTLPEGLTIAAVPERQDSRDALIGATLADLESGAALKIGTGSVRRRAILAARYPNVSFAEIRGNIDTRLRKLSEGGYDAIVLAVAGLARLGLHHSAEPLELTWFTPDPGQGALAVQARETEAFLIELLSSVDHYPSNVCIAAERAFLRAVGGGCRTPIGALATLEDGVVTLNAMLEASGSLRRCTVSAPAEEVERLGIEAARALVGSLPFPRGGEVG